MTRRVRVLSVALGVMLLMLVGCTEDEIAEAEGTLTELEGAAGQIEGAVSEIERELDVLGRQTEDTEDGQGGAGAGSTPAPAETVAPAGDDDSDGLPLWLLVLLAVLVLLLVIALFAALRGRSRAAERRRRLRDQALLETDWLIEAASERPSQVDAAARARDVRVHTDRLIDALRRLEQMSDRRVSEAIAELYAAATALAQTTIARLDDAAAGRPPGDDVGVEEGIQRVMTARNMFDDTVR
jgi:hypothetical protein